MAKVTIYDPEGREILREAVDARECVASGHYSFESPVKASVEPDGKVAADKKKTAKPNDYLV